MTAPRRTLLLHASAVVLGRFLSAATLLSLSACASQRAPKAPLDVRNLVVTRIKEWPPGRTTAPFAIALLASPSSTYSPPPISPALLGMAIGNAMRASQERDVRQLSSALSSVNLDPRAVLEDLLPPALTAKQVPFIRLSDDRLADAIHNKDYKSLPKEPEAVLDVQIHSAGYYANTKPDRFSPYFWVVARVLSTATQSIFEEFSYEAGDENSGGDRRYFAIPRAASPASLETFAQSGAAIRDQMVSALTRIAEAIAIDVARVVAKQPRLQ